jgi:hypothetical protein
MGRPKGGNQLTTDGAVAWAPVQKLLFLHSWNTSGNRDAYFYQQDIGEELEKRMASLRVRF